MSLLGSGKKNLAGKHYYYSAVKARQSNEEAPQNSIINTSGNGGGGDVLWPEFDWKGSSEFILTKNNKSFLPCTTYYCNMDTNDTTIQTKTDDEGISDENSLQYTARRSLRLSAAPSVERVGGEGEVVKSGFPSEVGGRCCNIQGIMFYCCEAMLMFIISGLALMYIFYLAPRFSAKPDATSKMHGFSLPKKETLASVPPVAQTQTTPPKQPIINPVVSQKSHGGGYWRQQLDHIASHLKLYAQSNKEFQKNVSEFQIGKVVGASVDATEGEGVFRLCLDFALFDGEENKNGSSPKKVKSKFQQSAKAKSDFLRKSRLDNFQNKKERSSSATAGSKRSESNSRERRSGSSSAGGRWKLSKESEDLLREVQMDKDLDEVLHLLDSGADPNLKDRDGVPVLVLVVKEFFQEAIQPLIEAGADPNVQFGPKQNTPLHEAVLLGPAGKQTIQALLKWGANAEIENKIGETAQALAIKHGYNELADILAANVSQKLLNH